MGDKFGIETDVDFLLVSSVSNAYTNYHHDRERFFLGTFSNIFTVKRRKTIPTFGAF